MALRIGRRKSTGLGVSCPWCDAPLRHEVLRPGTQNCPRCSKTFECVRFDPVEPRVVQPEAVALGLEQSAPCARHARNKADAACGRCGQFMCSLCRIDVEGKPYCPGCFERLSGEGGLEGVTTRFRNYAGLVSLSILLSFVCVGLPAMTFGIYFCIRGLKDKKARNETEGVVGLYLQLGLCILIALMGLLGIVAMFGAFRS